MSLFGQDIPPYVDHSFELWSRDNMSDYRGLIDEIEADKKERRERATQPKVAARDNTGKPKLSYFFRSFPIVVLAIARIKEFGANKYEEDNWRSGGKPDTEYLDSFFRHLDYFLAGEFYDQDSGCAHIGHMVWNLCALYQLNYAHKPAIDEDLFRERMAYWRQKKLDRLAENQKNPPTPVRRTNAIAMSPHTEKPNDS